MAKSVAFNLAFLFSKDYNKHIIIMQLSERGAVFREKRKFICGIRLGRTAVRAAFCYLSSV